MRKSEQSLLSLPNVYKDWVSIVTVTTALALRFPPELLVRVNCFLLSQAVPPSGHQPARAGRESQAPAAINMAAIMIIKVIIFIIFIWFLVFLVFIFVLQTLFE